MKLYSDYPVRRTFQILADAAAVLVVILAIWLATVVHDLVASLADAGRQLEAAGSGFRDTMADAGDTLGDVPLIGGGIRSPFDAASEAGATLANAGTAQQELVAQLAVVLAVIVAAVPIAAVLWVWLRRRILFVIRATRALAIARLPEGVEVLALRALVSASAGDLRSIDPAPVEGWRQREPRVVRSLADLELRESGVRSAAR